MKKKKPFLKRPGGIILISVLVLLIGGGIAAYAMRDALIKWIVGPVNYYIYKEYGNIEGLSTADFGIDGALTLGDELASVSKMLGTDTDDVKINVQHSVADKKTKLSLDLLGLFKTEFIKDGNYISFDNGSGKPITANIKKKTDSEKKKTSKPASQKPASTKTEEASEEFDLEEATGMGLFSFARWYLGFSDECITQPLTENMTEEREFYGDKECSVDTFTVNNDIYASVILNICNKYESDEDTKKVFDNLTEYFNKEYSLSLKTEELLSNWKAEAERVKKDTPFEYNYAVYYYDNQVVNRSITLVYSKDFSSSFEISLGSGQDSDMNYIDISLGNYVSGELAVKDSAEVKDISLDKKKAVSMAEFLKQTGIIDPNNKKQEKDTLDGIFSVLKYFS